MGTRVSGGTCRPVSEVYWNVTEFRCRVDWCIPGRQVLVYSAGKRQENFDLGQLCELVFL